MRQAGLDTTDALTEHLVRTVAVHTSEDERMMHPATDPYSGAIR